MCSAKLGQQGLMHLKPLRAVRRPGFAGQSCHSSTLNILNLPAPDSAQDLQGKVATAVP